MASNQHEQKEPTRFSVELPSGLVIEGKRWSAPNDTVDALPIIALHGWLDNCATYNLLGPEIDGDVYAVDLIGHGASSHRPKGVRYHLIDNVDDVLEGAAALGFEQFDLMGHSMGAGISTYVAAIAPERVNKLILIEGLGTHASPEEQAPEILATAVKDMRRAHNIKMPIYSAFSDAVAARRGVVGRVSEEAASHLCERGLVETAGGMTWTSDPRLKMGSTMRLTEDMVIAYLKKLASPTLFIGAEKGFFPTVGPLKIRVDAVQQLTQVTLPGNHHLHLEPDTYSKVADAINMFLKNES